MTYNGTQYGPQDTQDTPHRDYMKTTTDQHVGHEPDHPAAPQDHGGHGGHSWMMMLMCAPMLVIAIVLVATGVAGAGSILVALGCTVMMALMMRGMGGHGPSGADPK